MSQPSSTAPPGLVEKSVTGTAWIAAGSIYRQVLSLVSVSILARLLPPSAYGLMGLAGLVSNFLYIFRDLGLTTLLVQRASLSQAVLSAAFFLCSLLGAALAALMVVGALPISSFFNEPALARILRFLAISFFIGTLEIVPKSLLQRDLLFRKVAICEAMAVTCGTLLAIYMAQSGAGVWSLVAASLATATANTTSVWILAGWRPRRVSDWSELRLLISASVNLSGAHLLNYCARNADSVIIGRFLGTTALGYYQMAYTIMMYPLSYITDAITSVSLPVLSKLQADDARLRLAVCRLAALILFVTGPIMLGVLVTAPLIVEVFLSAKWLPSAVILRILSIAGLVQSVSCAIAVVYLVKSEPKRYAQMVLLTSSCYIAAFFIGLPGGINGVAIAYTTAVALCFYPLLSFPLRLINLPLATFLKHLAHVAACSMFMAAGAWACMIGFRHAGIEDPALRLVLTVLVGICMYLVVLTAGRLSVLKDLLDILIRLNQPLITVVATNLRRTIQ
jgi:O-antigen/teichoic acid export membrane protein